MLPSGLINPKCISVIGNGVVIHLPSFFAELKKVVDQGSFPSAATHSILSKLISIAGIDATGRLFISDRAHMVFDYHQVVDGIKEAELGRGSIGTTKKGIGPTYSAKASRSGIRIHHLVQNFPEFEARFRSSVINKQKRYGDFEYDVEAELTRYKVGITGCSWMARAFWLLLKAHHAAGHICRNTPRHCVPTLWTAHYTFTTPSPRRREYWWKVHKPSCLTWILVRVDAESRIMKD